MKEELFNSTFSCTRETYIEFMPRKPFPMGLTYIAGLIYSDMSEFLDNFFPGIY